jgi:hypothetical protein
MAATRCEASVGTREKPRKCGKPVADGMLAACREHQSTLIRTTTPGIYYRGARYAFTWRDAGGTQRWGSARLFDDARSLKSERERQARAGEEHVPTSEQPTLAEFAVELFGGDGKDAPTGRYQGRRGAIRDATRRDYARDLRVYWTPLLGARSCRPSGHRTSRGRSPSWLPATATST